MDLLAHVNVIFAYVLILHFPYLIVAYLVLCLLIGLAGLDRRIGFWGHFLVALVFTPIVGIVVLCTSEIRPKEKSAKR